MERTVKRYQRGWLVQMVWGSYLYVHLKMGSCIKLHNHFCEATHFCAIQFPFHKKETTLKSNIVYNFIKMVIQITVTTNRSGRRATSYLL